MNFTPREMAYAIAVDALYVAAAYQEHPMLADLTPAQKQRSLEQIKKLHSKLADAAKLDTTPINL